MKKTSLYILMAFVGFLSACNDDEENNSPAAPKDNVLELAIRTVKTDSLSRFTTTRTSFINTLKAQTGVVADAEFKREFSILGDNDTTTVYVGMTEYNNFATTQSINSAIGSSAAASAFMATFTPRVFALLESIEPATDPNLSNLIDRSSGQILEIAVRDTSGYTSMVDYRAKRDAFLEELKKQTGVVAEHQWVSVKGSGGTYAVGMTVYKDMAAFNTISSDTTFTKGKAMTEFLSNYPPMYGSIHTPVN